MKKEKNKIITAIVFIVIFIIAFIINYNSILVADDYSFYNNVWNGQTSFSFIRIFERTTNFYLTWTGRYVSTVVNYIFLAMDKIIFNIVNSIMFTGMIYIIYKIANKKEKENPILAVLSFLAVWFFMPRLGEVAFWQIGSVIYLWTYVGVLLVAYAYTRLIKNEKLIFKDNWITSIIILITSVIIGNGFETNSLMLVTFIILTILYKIFITKERLPKWSIFCAIGTIIGFCSNLFSPGNTVRMQSMTTGESLFTKITFGTGGMIFRGVAETQIYVLIAILIFCYYLYLILTKNKIFKGSGLITTVLSFGIMICIIFGGAYLQHKYNISTFLQVFYVRYKLFNTILVIGVVLIFANIMLMIIKRKKILMNTSKTLNTSILFYFISAIVGISSYIMTSLAWPRSYMGMSGFLIIAILLVVSEILSIIKDKKKVVNFIIIILLITFTIHFRVIIKEIIQTKQWYNNVQGQIQEKIDQGEEYIEVPTYMSINKYNVASTEKWVIPVKLEDEVNVTANGIHADYEWINIAITNYMFKDLGAWSNGKRIIGY